jgi:hypothetical protein
MRRWLDEPQMRAFFEGDTREIPERFTRVVQSHLGPLWHWLPPGALEHDPEAFVKSMTGSNPSAWSSSPAIAGAPDREPRPSAAIPDTGA